MLNPASPLAQLLHAPMRPGLVTWIGLRPVRREAVAPVSAVELDPEAGIVGDHYRSRGQRTRQVTLIQHEHLAAIGNFLGRADIDPALLRRNIAVSGINLLALQGSRFRVGDALLEATGLCHPCSRMEAAFGPGGYNAVRGHGGITTRVIEGGTIRLGDPVTRHPDAATP